MTAYSAMLVSRTYMLVVWYMLLKPEVWIRGATENVWYSHPQQGSASPMTMNQMRRLM